MLIEKATLELEIKQQSLQGPWSQSSFQPGETMVLSHFAVYPRKRVCLKIQMKKTPKSTLHDWVLDPASFINMTGSHWLITSALSGGCG